MQEELNNQEVSADVIIIDGLPPEEGAMSQALYSRKPDSILKHLLRLSHEGAEKFMDTYYSGYGHNSIGDCGSATLYLENISMLGTKAIQAPSLYNGQEASTRYLDFSGRTMINPLGGQLASKYVFIPSMYLDNKEELAKMREKFETNYVLNSNDEAGKLGNMIQTRWMDFYQTHMPDIRHYVMELNPISEGQNQAQYDKAMNARTFDIMRCFIPAGMTTMVSWHSNIRQLRDRLAVLKYHPCTEIQRLANTALASLKATYPASFNKKEYPDTEEYLKLKAKRTSYFDDFEKRVDFALYDWNFSERFLENYKEILEKRPEKTELPNEIGEAGTVNVCFDIDFGSFRDAQRHRKGVCKMPLLTTRLGFHEWYLDRLPEDVRKKAEELIAELEPLINSLPCSDEERQYYIPMGYVVVADFTWTFDQCVYVAELRSSETVHPTFRIQAQKLGKWIEEVVPNAKLYVDYSGDKFSYKRGSQDIHEKQKQS